MRIYLRPKDCWRVTPPPEPAFHNLPATVEVDNWKRWGAGLYATPTATGKRELGRLLNWLSGLSFIASKQITPQDNLHMSLYRRRKGCDTETFKDGIARIRSDPTCKPRGRVRVLSIVLKELGADYSNAVVLAHWKLKVVALIGFSEIQQRPFVVCSVCVCASYKVCMYNKPNKKVFYRVWVI